MRRVLSTAVVALVIAALAGAPLGTVAQGDPADDPISPARVVRGLNADKIDGKHASRYTLRRAPRAKKVVATNRGGMLPANIIEPLWHLIQGKPAWLADNQIHWDEIVGKPATTIFATAPCPNPVAPGGDVVVFPNLPRVAMYDFQVVPHTNPAVGFVTNQLVAVQPDSLLTIVVFVDPLGAANGHCNIRASAQLGDGVTAASVKTVKNRLNKTKVRYTWKGPRP